MISARRLFFAGLLFACFYQPSYAADLADTYGAAIAITPSDTKAPQMGNHIASDALYFVGTASTGALVVVMADGSTQTFSGLTVASGQTLPLRVRNVLSTGTTVTSIIALFH